MGMGTILTGLIIEFKAMTIGGIIGLLMSIPHYLLTGHEIQIFQITLSGLGTISFILAFVAMYIIPGHILNYRAKKACLKN